MLKGIWLENFAIYIIFSFNRTLKMMIVYFQKQFMHDSSFPTYRSFRNVPFTQFLTSFCIMSSCKVSNVLQIQGNILLKRSGNCLYHSFFTMKGTLLSWISSNISAISNSHNSMWRHKLCKAQLYKLQYLEIEKWYEKNCFKCYLLFWKLCMFKENIIYKAHFSCQMPLRIHHWIRSNLHMIHLFWPFQCFV